jgi:hypothetical protein
MCLHTIDRDNINRILRNPVTHVVPVKYEPDDNLVDFLRRVETAQPHRLRNIIEKTIKRCIFYYGTAFNEEMHTMLKLILMDFNLEIEIWKDWNEYDEILSRRVTLLSLEQLERVVSKLGTPENKETLRTMTSPDYIDVDAKTFVENEIANGNIAEADSEQAYINAKNENFASIFNIIFSILRYKFNTLPIIHHIPTMDEEEKYDGDEYWKSLLTDPLFIILRRIVLTLSSMGKFHYVVQA